jgi:hypothetical protein
VRTASGATVNRKIKSADFHSPEMSPGSSADAAAQSITAGVRKYASRFIAASR